MSEPQTPRHPSRPAGRILVIEPMASGLEMLKAARETGLEVVAISANEGDRAVPSVLGQHIDRLIELETNDEPALVEAALRLHAEAPFRAVIPGFEFYVDSAARLAARLGLPGLDPAAAERLRDKARMRAAVAAAGLRVPLHQEARTAGELDMAADHVGFPAVLKPTTSAGSVHVSRVDNLTDLRRAYAWMAEDSRTDLGRGLDGRVLLEEYVAGPEVSVEGYVVDGAPVIVSVTAKELGPEPYFVEVGHTVHRDLEPEERARIDSYVTGVCQALGVTLGPFHCELRLPAGDPVLIEIGARLAGDHICDLIELATGVSLPRIMLAAYADLPLEEVAPARVPSAKYAAIHFFTAPGLATLSRVDGWESMTRDESVVEAELYLSPGDDVPPMQDFRGRIGHVIYRADSFADAAAARAAFGRMVRFG
ncbi:MULTISPECIES: ATP-grasp domain-containing protein [Streptomyces]|uniref:ATP-grasp domain-containing protein n=1 Tax=Streptomyces TaxID=1883 RepID=UPI00167919D8|nr:MULTISPECIES: ATP-grasp domain-containing protein [Streptomyces]MBK3525796.1 ATP-grasp domain-containing protein [Streptomyces sp. MBT70]GGS13627.1 phosphoribosylglycinamide synthetase [Streptomyces eurythermus]